MKWTGSQREHALPSYASILSGCVTYTAEPSVASLSIRRLDNETLSRLRIRAVKRGVSMEEEARRILSDAVSAPDQLGDLALRIFGPQHGVDLQLPEGTLHEPPGLSE